MRAGGGLQGFLCVFRVCVGGEGVLKECRVGVVAASLGDHKNPFRDQA
jgi:hypothetical protein